MIRLRLLLAALVVAASACDSSSNGDETDGGGPLLPPDDTSGLEGGTDRPDGATADGEPPPPPPKVDVTTEALGVWGETREFVLAVPKNYDRNRSYPLVLAFHGDGGSGPGLRAGWRFDDVTGYDAIVVYPTGKNAAWDLYTPSDTNADNGFMEALLAHLTERFSIDTTRVFGTGFSKGAFFANQYACRRSSFFRAIAPHAGGAPHEPNDPNASFHIPGYTKCANQSGGVAAMVFHGEVDGAVLRDSGDFTAMYWAYVNGCNTDKKARYQSPPAPCLSYSGCPTGKQVTYCEIPGMGHGIWDKGMWATWEFFKSF